MRVWADVKKKHAAHAITADVSLGETAATVEFMLGDAVIVTGSTTGEPPRAADVREAKSHCRIPVLLGSGVTVENVSEFYATADGFIVGSYLKSRALVEHGRACARREACERLETFTRSGRGRTPRRLRSIRHSVTNTAVRRGVKMLLRRLPLVFLSFAFIFFSAAALLSAQSGVRPKPSPTPQDEEAERIYIEEVRLPVFAYDEQGRPDIHWS